MEQQPTNNRCNPTTEDLHNAYLLTTDINRLLAASGSLFDRMERIAARLCTGFAVDTCVIRRLESGCLRLIAGVGLPPNCQFPCMPANYGISRLVLENWRPVCVADVESHPILGPVFAAKRGFPFLSYTSVPLASGGAIRGMLGLFMTSCRRGFSPFELDTLEAIGCSIAMLLQAEAASEEFAQLEHDHSAFPTQLDVTASTDTQNPPTPSSQTVPPQDYRYRSLVELTSDWIWETDAQNRYTFVSHQIVDILGFRPEELIGTDPNDWLLQKDRVKADAFRTRILADRSPFSRVVSRQCTKDGRTVYIEISALPLFDTQGNLLGYRGINRDITEQQLLQKQQRATAQELKEQNESLFVALERYELASRDTQSGVWDLHIDPETLQMVSPLYYSPHLNTILGFTSEHADNTLDTIVERIHPDDLPMAMQAMLAFLRGESREYEVVIRMRHQNGSWRSLVFRATAIRNESGIATRAIGIYADITERIHQEAELRHSQQLIAQIADSTPDIIFLYDLINDCSVYSNRSIATILGYTPEEIQAGGSGFVPSLVHSEDIKSVQEQSRRRDEIPEGQFLEMEYRLRHKDGSWKWLWTREAIFRRTETGIPHQILGIAQDITERKRMKSVLEEHTRQQQAITTAIQQSLLSCAPLSAESRLEVETLYEPARNETLISGDILDYFPLSTDRYALVVGDIMGKGLAAALDMAQLKFALRAYLADTPDPVEAMQRLNQYLLHLHQSNSLAQKDCFAGMSIAVVNTETGELRLAVAGMNPPIILGEQHEDVVFRNIATGGSPLGVLPDWEPDGLTECQLEKGGILALYSDGFTDTHNFCSGPDFELFGSQRFRESLVQAHRNQQGDLRGIASEIIATVREFSHGRLTDDMCLLLARRR